MGLYAFSKEERIRRRTDFLKISREGERYQTVHFRVTICPNNLSLKRLGIAVGKGVGPAVKRNRVKRLVREFFRLNKGELPGSHDFVITAKEGAADLDYWEAAEELKGILGKR